METFGVNLLYSLTSSTSNFNDFPTSSDKTNLQQKNEKIMRSITMIRRDVTIRFVEETV